jgi:hypothetical protein
MLGIILSRTGKYKTLKVLLVINILLIITAILLLILN